MMRLILAIGGPPRPRGGPAQRGDAGPEVSLRLERRAGRLPQILEHHYFSYSCYYCSSYSYSYYSYLKLGRAVLMVEIGVTDAKATLKRPSGAPRTSQRQPQNAPKAIFGSKKRANEAQESSKTNLEALFGRSRGPKELPRAPQEPPKSSQKEAERASKRSQNHHWIENADFSKIELPLS